MKGLLKADEQTAARSVCPGGAGRALSAPTACQLAAGAGRGVIRINMPGGGGGYKGPGQAGRGQPNIDILLRHIDFSLEEL